MTPSIENIDKKLSIINGFYDYYKKMDSKERGIPVIARMLYKGKLKAKTKIIASQRTGSEGKARSTWNHPEAVLISLIKQRGGKGKADLIVTLSPCSDCRAMIESCNKINKVYYLLENTGNKDDTFDFQGSDKYFRFIEPPKKDDFYMIHKFDNSHVHKMSEELSIHQDTRYGGRRMEGKSNNDKVLVYDKETMTASIYPF